MFKFTIHWLTPAKPRRIYGVDLSPLDQLKGVDALVVAVAHQSYRDMGLLRLSGLCDGSRAVVVDVKSAFDPGDVDSQGISYWRL
jgi:UDP-N-acetyl-D-galactosamine dehydrogenase